MNVQRTLDSTGPFFDVTQGPKAARGVGAFTPLRARACPNDTPPMERRHPVGTPAMDMGYGR